MRIISESIKPFELRNELIDSAAGAYVGFEGWVRNHNDGQEVYQLEYEVYEFLAVKEGEEVISEAKERHQILRAHSLGRA